MTTATDTPRMADDGAFHFPIKSVGFWLVAIGVALALDGAAWSSISIHDSARLARIESKDWYRTARVFGSVWPWIIVVAAFVLVDRKSDLRWRAGFITAAIALAGIAAELLKPLVGRMKPHETDGAVVFAQFSERIGIWSDLGMASSHAAVAFAGAFALQRMFPRAGWVFVAAAALCGLTRIVAGAHFLSDVVAGAFLAWVVVWWIGRDRATQVDEESSAVEAA